VNVFGPHRVTRALAPLLVESRGRVVNVGSQGGMLAMGGFGPYTMTKHALEAFTTALADELAPHGVEVSIVQPGGFVSAIGEKAWPGTQARLERTPPPFDGDARRFLDALRAPAAPREDEPESATNRKPSPTSLVTDAVLDALFAARPRRRTLVGTRWEGERVVRALLERLVEADECPALGLGRAELVARLDAALARRAVPPPADAG